jgi:hypothetical protein
MEKFSPAAALVAVEVVVVTHAIVDDVLFLRINL